ncbi:hypothetical protein UABAM_02817 [Candidatus Uabimicrobium amorphum]|uniref:Uncharacterized protein n=1 Tax=Uabimicrobium amorphum TaxID=2596890 RepID=A0A5S9F378_UABAM|nr:hypothetical protein UABAM_02817 [Candidatus Uabimicrobium amorphum]
MKMNNWAIIDLNSFIIIICIQKMPCGNFEIFVVQFNTFGADLRICTGIVNSSFFNEERFDWLEFFKWKNC